MNAFLSQRNPRSSPVFRASFCPKKAAYRKQSPCSDDFESRGIFSLFLINFMGLRWILPRPDQGDVGSNSNAYHHKEEADPQELNQEHGDDQSNP